MDTKYFEADIADGQLTRLSLGRLGFIGELYDVRTESFSSRSLIKKSSNLIEHVKVGHTVFDYKFVKNISDRFELINVEPQLQVSILLGLIHLEGSGKFLLEDKKSEKSVSCSLIWKILTEKEKFFAPFDEFLNNVDLTALNDPQYTHVIAEVDWGANFLLTLEVTCDSDSEKQEVEGSLAAEISKLKNLFSFKSGGNLQKEDSTLTKRKNVKIKVCADIVLDDNLPTSIKAFSQMMSDLPRLLKKENNGKGKPLSYVMIPLSTLRRIAKIQSAVNVIVKKIDESFYLSVIYLFEEIYEIKQKFQDLITTLQTNKKYVKEDEIKRAKRQQESLLLKETELKLIIADRWVQVKSGEKPLKDLMREIEKFKSLDLKLYTYEEFLNSFSSTINKLSIVQRHISEGIIYLGIGEKFDTFQSMHLSCEFFVLVISTESELFDPELHKNTCYYFLTLAVQKKPDTKYVIVDLDYVNTGQFSDSASTETKCYNLKGTQILSSDLYAEYLLDLESNYAQLKAPSTMSYTHHKPGNRVMLEMVCPGFEKGSCSSDILTWICYRCKTTLEYGFDENFYCSCGKGSANNFEYRCSHKKHGSLFVSPELNSLKTYLSKLRPLKEMNLLILGQSGVGKSTWINSIINYLTYDSLETAQKYGVISTIPAKFTMFDSKTLKKHVVKIGEETDREETGTGLSGTQYAHTYNFLWENRCVRIIDTPGLGDTRGINQDKINLSNIIYHIGHLKELHGVCILLKANDNRINAVFAYCLKELLTHLHKSIVKNIVFCFTNARSSFYSPGQTSAILDKALTTLVSDADLALGHHNMFCLDNEAFLFLCSLNYPEITHEEHLVKSFSQSWEISLKETTRLFNTVKNFEPHILKDTLSLIKARNRILYLTKPIADCSKTLQLNLSALEKKTEEIKASDMAIKELTEKLNFTEIHLEAVPVPKPRTVCTSPSCIQYLTYKTLDVRDVEYKTICHNECYLTVTPKTTNNVLLQNCTAMQRNGKCVKCGCGWESHMHLTYIQKRIEKIVTNKNVEKFLKTTISAKEAMENFTKELKSNIDKYEKEQEFIIQTSVKFGMFLRRNAIACFNDSVEDYLEYLIKEEEEKPFKSEMEKKLLENMKNTLAYYKAEVKILQEVIKKGDSETEELTSADISEYEQKLYNLELMGETIRKNVEMNRSTTNRMMQYSETPIQITKYTSTKTSWRDSIMNKLFDQGKKQKN